MTNPSSRIPPPSRRHTRRQAAATASEAIHRQVAGNDSEMPTNTENPSGQENNQLVTSQTPPPFPHFSTLSTDNREQESVINTLREETSEDRTGSDLTTWISLQIPATLLFSEHVWYHIRLFTVTYQFLKIREVRFDPQSRETLMTQVAKALYCGEDLDHCLTFLQNKSVIGNPSASAQNYNHNSSRTNTSDPHDSARKVVSSLSQRFQSSRQFSGSENLQNVLTSYRYATKDLHLSEDQKLQYLHHLFRDDALVFYQNNVEGKCDSFQDAITRIEAEFNPLSRQMQVYRSLRSLSFHTFENQASNLTDALDKLNFFILNEANQVPSHHRNEENKVEFLRDAVTGCQWAREVLIQTSNSPIQYQQLLARLHGAITAGEASNDKADKLFPTHYTTGQKMYGRNPRHNRPSHELRFQHGSRPHQYRQNNYDRHPNQRRPPFQKQMNCWNCGSVGHILKDCRKPHNVSDITSRKLSYYNRRFPNQQNKVVRRVLYELASQMDTPDSDSCEQAFPTPQYSEHDPEEEEGHLTETNEEATLEQDVGSFSLQDEPELIDTLLTSSENHQENPQLYETLQDF